MTQRVTVSLPDELAEQLAGLPNVSAYVAEAIRDRLRAEASLAALRQSGFNITPEGLERARQRMAAARAEVTPESLAESMRLIAEVENGW